MALPLEDDLRLLVELGALGLVDRLLRLYDEVVEFLVAPLRAVVTADGIATQQGVQEVVRIAIVAGPAEDDGAVAILRLRLLEILGPFVGDDLSLHADSGEVGSAPQRGER
jgi:hypothetical protein